MLETIAVTNDTLRAEAQKLFDGGWRLVTYTATKCPPSELRDLFGLTFEGLVLDYSGTLYLEGDVNRAPFCSFTTVRKEKG